MLSADFSIPSSVAAVAGQIFQQSFRIGAALLRNFQGAAYTGGDLKSGLDAKLRRQLVTALQERIRQKMENCSEKQVYLRGDGGVQYQDLVDVFDRLKAAGVEQVGLVAKLPGER